jgi:hypothetical protein
LSSANADAAGGSAPAERGTLKVNSANSANGSGDATSTTSLADVPAPVRDAAKKIAGSQPIQSISPHLNSSGMVYDVTYGNQNKRTITLNKDGAVQKPAATSKP